MLYKFIYIFLLVKLILFLCVLYLYITHYDSKYSKPIFHEKVNIKNLQHLSFNYFLKNFSDIPIFIAKSKSNSIDINGKIKKLKLIEYYNDIILKNNTDWYFKTEDEYDFLKQIGIKDQVINEFSKIFDKNISNISHKQCSFWMGCKNSNTGWHTDIDDLSFLYVIEGKKKIQLIHPKYNKSMYEKRIYTDGARWSNIDFKNIDYNKYPMFKNVEITSYILNEGDAVFIPSNWWHCVENLEDTIGITYKIYRTSYLYFTKLPEIIRKEEYKKKKYKIFNQLELIKKILTKEEFEKYKQLFYS